jgi:carbonic anhydrase
MTKIKALVLTCMDYRFVDCTKKKLDEMGYGNAYDLHSIAGASLAFESMTVYDKNYLKETIDYHIQTAIALHEIEEFIIIDHKDCGAYKVRYGEETMKDSEMGLHKSNCSNMYRLVKTKYPDLKVSAYLIGRDDFIDMKVE